MPFLIRCKCSKPFLKSRTRKVHELCKCFVRTCYLHNIFRRIGVAREREKTFAWKLCCKMLHRGFPNKLAWGSWEFFFQKIQKRENLDQSSIFPAITASFTHWNLLIFPNLRHRSDGRHENRIANQMEFRFWTLPLARPCEVFFIARSVRSFQRVATNGKLHGRNIFIWKSRKSMKRESNCSQRLLVLLWNINIQMIELLAHCSTSVGRFWYLWMPLSICSGSSASLNIWYSFCSLPAAPSGAMSSWCRRFSNFLSAISRSIFCIVELLIENLVKRVKIISKLNGSLS